MKYYILINYFKLLIDNWNLIKNFEPIIGVKKRSRISLML